jgi:hypothetical protein
LPIALPVFYMIYSLRRMGYDYSLKKSPTNRTKRRRKFYTGS